MNHPANRVTKSSEGGHNGARPSPGNLSSSSVRVRRQLLLLAIAAVLAYVLFLLVPGRALLERVSMLTGYLGLVLIAVSLAIGPLNILRAASNPPSINLRRDIGIFAGIVTIAHVIFGLQVHLGGDFVRYFLEMKTGLGITGIRLDGFGVANHFGLIAALITLVLLSISNNLSIRKLGPRMWKGIQRWSYVGAFFVVVHALLYQAVERRQVAFIAGVLILAGAVLYLQLVGFRRRTLEGVKDRALGRARAPRT